MIHRYMHQEKTKQYSLLHDWGISRCGLRRSGCCCGENDRFWRPLLPRQRRLAGQLWSERRLLRQLRWLSLRPWILALRLFRLLCCIWPLCRGLTLCCKCAIAARPTDGRRLLATTCAAGVLSNRIRRRLYASVSCRTSAAWRLCAAAAIRILGAAAVLILLHRGQAMLQRRSHCPLLLRIAEAAVGVGIAYLLMFLLRRLLTMLRLSRRRLLSCGLLGLRRCLGVVRIPQRILLCCITVAISGRVADSRPSVLCCLH